VNITDKEKYLPSPLNEKPIEKGVSFFTSFNPVYEPGWLLFYLYYSSAHHPGRDGKGVAGTYS